MQSEPSSANPNRFAEAFATALAHAQARLDPKRKERIDAHISEWLEGHESDATALVRNLLTEAAEHPDTPENVRPIFRLMTRPEHQTQAILTVLGVYPIISAFVMAAVNPYVTDIAKQANTAHPSQPLSPAELALAKLRNTPTSIDFYAEALNSGIDRERFDLLEYITGEPPGLMQLLEAFRRGYIDRETLHRGVLQSRVRDEWFETIVRLRYAPPSPLEAVAAAVKGHLPDDMARELASEAGLDPQHFDWIKATAGRPPGAEGLMQLYNRKIIDGETFAEGIRQSDIQNRWIPELLEMRRYLPPPRSIVSMLHHGAITDEKATQLFEDHGVFPEDIAIFLAEGHSSRTETIKHLALGEVSKLYEARMVTLAEATMDVEALGYNADEARQILALVDSAKERKYLEAGIARVRSLFVAHRITITEASNDLDKLEVEPSERDRWLKLWTLEASSNVRVLTLAQVQGAWRRKIMPLPEATRRLLDLGYHADDVPYLLALAIPPTKYNQRIPAEAGF